MAGWMTQDEAVRFLDGCPPLTHQERCVLFADLTSEEPMELIAAQLRTTTNSAWKSLSSARRKIKEQVEAECESDLICDFPHWAYDAGRILKEAILGKSSCPSNPLAGAPEGSTRGVADRIAGRRLTDYDFAAVAAAGGSRIRMLVIPWDDEAEALWSPKSKEAVDAGLEAR